MFCFWSLLVAKQIVKEVVLSFMIVGHMHDDIDASFGRWSMELRDKDHPTLPLLMQSYMSMEEASFIPHLIEEVPDFKAKRKALHWNEQKTIGGPFKRKAIQVFCRQQQVAHHAIQTSMYQHPMVAQGRTQVMERGCGAQTHAPPGRSFVRETPQNKEQSNVLDKGEKCNV